MHSTFKHTEIAMPRFPYLNNCVERWTSQRTKGELLDKRPSMYFRSN